MTCALGQAVPPFTPHAISVSLPTWRDTVGYEEGEARVVDAMVSGYPRFFINLGIRKLARVCKQKFGATHEDCMLFPSRSIANACRVFMTERARLQNIAVPVRLVQFVICPDDTNSGATCIELHIVLFPEDQFPLAKQFWQHTGLGISSRLAERSLIMLQAQDSQPTSPVSPRLPTYTKPSNRHYSKPSRTPPVVNLVEDLDKDHSTYLEERYGRNLPQEAAKAAKRALRRRIAGTLVHDTPNDWNQAGHQNAEVGPSTRGVAEVTEDDVYLYPTGMAAIWNAHQLALGTRPSAKSVCFGFPYTDTLKILEKWGPGCFFLGNGLDADIDELEHILERESTAHLGQPPILALFTEFPSNPLLRCADLPRLRALADKYDFLIVVDDTIGNFVNVEVLPYSDVAVSSLSKIFSGDANAMGGNLVLNPKGRHYSALKEYMTKNYEDTFFDEDAIYMERNSRDFVRRIRIIDENTEALCDFLCSKSLASSSSSTNVVIKNVFYPKYTTTEHYNRCKVSDPGAGYGGLFSVTFITIEAARAFFDTLSCYKGPSLGTNFTLACPYAILAHYVELDWAEKYGIEASLVRVSTGMEDRRTLLEDFNKALKAAEATLSVGCTS